MSDASLDRARQFGHSIGVTLRGDEVEALAEEFDRIHDAAIDEAVRVVERRGELAVYRRGIIHQIRDEIAALRRGPR